MATLIGSISLDGTLTDWTSADRLDLPGTVNGYGIYGKFAVDATGAAYYVFAIDASGANTPIGANTTLWLDTDKNTSTGYQIWGWAAGAEYNVNFSPADGAPYLYTGAAGQTFVGSAALPFAFNANKTIVEFAVPVSQLAGAPQSINVYADVNDNVFLPTSYALAAYSVSAPNTTSTTFGTITLDATINAGEWMAGDKLDTVSNIALYGKYAGNAYVFAIDATAANMTIGANTTLWFNTDQNPDTGYKIWGWAGGVEYDVQFALDGTPYLYNAVTGAVASGALPFHYDSLHHAVEFAVPISLLPGAPKAMDIYADINDQVFLPSSYALAKYTVAQPFTAQTYGAITIDGKPIDWTATDRLDLPGTGTAGYAEYGHFDGTTYTFALQTPTGVQIGNGSVIWLDTDTNPATGYKIWGWAGGVEYDVKFDATGKPSLYSMNATTGAETLVNAQLTYAYSADKSFVELAIPGSSLGSTVPQKMGVLANVNNTAFQPNNFVDSEYVVVNSATLPVRTSPAHKIAIVYSDTTAEIFWGNADHNVNKTGYSELFMAAQYQAMQAGVPFDVISEADLKDLSKIVQYDALVFPSFRDVKTADAWTIEQNLIVAAQKYHVGMIAAGEFMTNDQTGAAMAGDPYVRMKELFDITRAGGGTANIDLAANTGSSIMKGYAANEDIHSYSNIGYNYYTTADGTQATVLANEVIGGTVSNGIVNGGTAYNAVVQTHTGGTNVHFATESFLGDNNILGQAIKNAVYGSGLSASLKESRFNQIVASRTDMDQSQYPDDVSPGSGPGIYDKLLPILQQWKTQYNFVGSYYINIGDTPSAGRTTNWDKSLPIYQALIAMGNEIGNHSYTHLAALAAEDTALLALSGTGPGTIDYEFNQSKQIINQKIGSVVPGYTDLGAAVPGMPEKLPVSQAIEQYFAYVTGGYTGIGAGYPGAFGYLTPGNQNSVYLAPDITFDFTQIQWLHHTAPQADAAWAAEFAALNNHASTPIVVWPWHDYGATNWFNDGFDISMFTNMVARAASSGAEFVTLADLASRINNFHNASLTTTVSGNTITATVTPGTGGDLGTFGLDVNFATAGQVIQNVTNWYAYNDHAVFVNHGSGTFVVNAGTAQDDVTHISSLAMRADLQSLQGDGTNLRFSEFGDGSDVVTLKTPGTNVVMVQGADTASLSGNALTLTFNTLGQHDVTIQEVPAGTVTAPAVVDPTLAVNAILFGGLANDTFAFAKGFGKDVISDYHTGDAIQFSSNVFTTFDQVKAAMTQVPDAAVPAHADVVITAGTDAITLKNYLLANLQASDFKFVT